MSTFEITTYTERLPCIKLDRQSGRKSEAWMGHMGKDGAFMLKNAVSWATDSGITGDVREAFSRLFDYARTKYIFPEQDSVMLTLRKVISSDDFKIPRPHHDGTFWSKDLNTDREQFKIGTVLCGPGTLLWDTSKLDGEVTNKVQHMIARDMNKRAREKGTDTLDIEIRKWATQQLEEMGAQIVTLQANECLRWVVGDPERAAVHSEPDVSDMPEGRVFVALLPGTEKQIRDLAARWKEPYHADDGQYCMELKTFF